MLDAETLATLLADPARADALPPETVAKALGDVEHLRAVLWTCLMAFPGDASRESPAPSPEAPDRLLNAGEVADRLNVDKKWVYRHTDGLPFARRLSSGTLRFSERGLERWIERR